MQQADVAEEIFGMEILQMQHKILEMVEMEQVVDHQPQTMDAMVVQV